MNYWVAIYKSAWAILIALFCVGLVCVFMPKCHSLRELQRRKIELQEANRQVAERTRQLIANQERFSSDPDFVERTAKEAGLIKPNEVVFKFTNEAPRPVIHLTP